MEEDEIWIWKLKVLSGSLKISEFWSNVQQIKSYIILIELIVVLIFWNLFTLLNERFILEFFYPVEKLHSLTFIRESNHLVISVKNTCFWKVLVHFHVVYYANFLNIGRLNFRVIIVGRNHKLSQYSVFSFCRNFISPQQKNKVVSESFNNAKK